MPGCCAAPSLATPLSSTWITDRPETGFHETAPLAPFHVYSGGMRESLLVGTAFPALSCPASLQQGVGRRKLDGFLVQHAFGRCAGGSRTERFRLCCFLGGGFLFHAYHVDVHSMQAFGSFANVVGDLLSRFEASVSIHANVGVMHEEILTYGIWTNKAVTLGVIEPLHFPGCHNSSPSVGTTSSQRQSCRLLLFLSSQTANYEEMYCAGVFCVNFC